MERISEYFLRTLFPACAAGRSERQQCGLHRPPRTEVMHQVKGAILVLLLAASWPIHADTWEQTNRSGDRIVLTDRPCEEPPALNLKEMYSYTSSGITMRGCWVVIDDMVHIGWEDGHHSVHRQDSFQDGVVDQPYMPPLKANDLRKYRPATKPDLSFS
jgi:hypothetical protein